MRELEPGLIVSAVVCLILFLDVNFGRVTRELSAVAFVSLILSAVAFWSSLRSSGEPRRFAPRVSLVAPLLG